MPTSEKEVETALEKLQSSNYHYNINKLFF